MLDYARSFFYPQQYPSLSQSKSQTNYYDWKSIAKYTAVSVATVTGAAGAYYFGPVALEVVSGVLAGLSRLAQVSDHARSRWGSLRYVVRCEAGP